MSPDKILLGFEVESGRDVYMETHHLVVTGQTQKSGKTTLIEGLIKRSKKKAIVFKTKRGESGFENYHTVPLYFKEQAGWQYVESVIESTLGEKMKFSRPWIMRASQGASTLKEVWANIKRLQGVTRNSFNKDQYMVLDEYFKIVIPEMEKYTFSNRLELEQGINVMDLTGMKTETQSLIIQSSILYVHEKLRNTIVVIPEAWKFVPQGIGNPVKKAASTLIREGAAIHNYLWVDSQTITSIDKEILKQCNNWIMGLQIEINEVNRTKEQTGKRISDRAIMSLKLGHFYAYLGDTVTHVYALPANVPVEMGRRVAIGTLPVEKVKEYLQSQGKDDEAMYREKFEQSEVEKQELRNRIAELKAAKPVETLSTDVEAKIAEAVAKAKVESDQVITDLKLVSERAIAQAGAAEQLRHEAERATGDAERRAREAESNLASIESAVNKIESLRLAVTDFLKPMVVDAVKSMGLTGGTAATLDLEPLRAEVKRIAEKVDAGPQAGLAVSVGVESPTFEVVHTVKTVKVTTDDLLGKIALLYVECKFPTGTIWGSSFKDLFINRGWEWSKTTAASITPILMDFSAAGILETQMGGQGRRDFALKLSPEEAKAKGLIRFTEKTV